MSKTLVLWVKVADDLGKEEEAALKRDIAESLEDHDSGAIVRVNWQEDQE